jgi:hypothetical protein
MKTLYERMTKDCQKSIDKFCNEFPHTGKEIKNELSKHSWSELTVGAAHTIVRECYEQENRIGTSFTLLLADLFDND